MSVKLSRLATIIKSRVARGAKFLDKIEPGWYNKIDVSKFDIEDGCDCILGQVYGDFWNAVERVFKAYKSDRKAAISHGFLQDDIYLNGNTVVYDTSTVPLLEEFWILEINNRKTVGKAKKVKKACKTTCKVH